MNIADAMRVFIASQTKVLASMSGARDWRDGYQAALDNVGLVLNVLDETVPAAPGKPDAIGDTNGTSDTQGSGSREGGAETSPQVHGSDRE